MATTERRAVIRRLVSSRPVGTQEELLALLQKRHLATTQATLSRDLTAIGAFKERDEEGRLRYVLPDPLPAVAEQRLQRALRASQSQFDRQDRLLAIHTQPGAAQVVAATLRLLPLREVFIVLGDDAGVLLVCRSERGAQSTLQWLRALRDDRVFSS